MNASGVGLHLGAVDLGAVAREAVARVTEEFPDPRAPVSLHVEAPVIGRWDRRRCEQMVTHLLSNAASYGEHHPIEVDVTGDGETARIVVDDTAWA
jgi:signal transduction histidine kinase